MKVKLYDFEHAISILEADPTFTVLFHNRVVGICKEDWELMQDGVEVDYQYIGNDGNRYIVIVSTEGIPNYDIPACLINDNKEDNK